MSTATRLFDPGYARGTVTRPRVLMVTTSYPRDAMDWKGGFIRSLVQGLTSSGAVDLRLWGPPGDVPAELSYVTPSADARWLEAVLARGGIAHILRQHPIGGLSTAMGLMWRLRRAYRDNADCDLVHVNWLQNALPLWGSRIPAVVGVLGADLKLLSVPGVTAALRRVFASRPTVLAPNADWMAPELERHFGDVCRVRVVPFGVDAQWFDVTRTRPAQTPRQWLVVLRLTRKKMGPLFDWSRDIVARGDEVHLLGPMQETLELPHWITYHGATWPDALLREWFPRVAGLITLSQHDEGRPQVVLEAMAAGLPVIASDIPAHRNVLQHRVTGMLVRDKSDFEQATLELSEPSRNVAIGTAARAWLRDNVGTWTDCAQRYTTAYEQALEART